MTQTDEPTQEDKPNWSSWARENLVWLITLVPLAVAGWRVMLAATGDQQKLQALLGSLDVFSLVLGVVLPAVPTLLFWGFVWLFDWWRQRSKEQRDSLPDWLPPLALAPMLSALLMMNAVNLAVNLASVGVLFIWRWRRYTRHGITAQLNFSWPIVFTLTTAVITTPAMWLPKEALSFKTQEPDVGYVLASDSQWTTYLRQSGPVERVLTSDVTGREVCSSANHWSSQSVIGLFVSEERRTPPCPTP